MPSLIKLLWKVMMRILIDANLSWEQVGMAGMLGKRNLAERVGEGGGGGSNERKVESDKGEKIVQAVLISYR